jgi:predicted Zn-dependent protease
VVNGKSVHVAFRPKTGGSSVFYTDNDAIAAALEAHYKYGKLFRKTEEIEPQIAPAPSKETPKEEEPKVKVKEFASYEDAKDWLVDTFEISRTKLRSKNDINKAAKANGFELKIGE